MWDDAGANPPCELSAFGGLFALAIAGSYFIAGLLNVPFVLNPGIIIIAFLFSAVVGVIFGFFPARKAAPKPN